MRYKESTLSKLEAQSMKLKTLQRAIQNGDWTANEAILFINQVITEIDTIVERLGLEPNE
jgi:ribosome assembly protein YihI (activator of Der GTPase)